MAVFLCFVFFMCFLPGNVPGASAEQGGSAESAQQESGASSFDPTARGESYTAVLYDNMNGLPTSEANAIAETPDGFLWIGSYSGLIRHDGNTFERMDSTSGIASVVCLFVDSKDRLWVGTNDAGVAVIDQKGEIKTFRMKDGLTSESIRAITEDSDGSIYVAMTKGIARINQDMDIQIVDHYVIKGQYIIDITTGADGLVYGLTRNGEIFTLVGKGQMNDYQYMNRIGIDETISSIFPDPDAPGYVYLGSEESTIYRVSITNANSTVESYDVSPLSHINSITRIDGRIWVCADAGGCGVLDGNTFRRLQGIPMNNSIEKVHRDYAGNLWFASSRQGVMKVVRNRFTDILSQYKDQLKSVGVENGELVVNSTCMYNTSLLLGTDSGLFALNESGRLGKLFIEDAEDASGNPVEINEMVEFLQGIRVRSVIRDSKNRIWISTYSDYGLIRYDRGHVKLFTKKDGMPSNRVRTVRECSDGSFLVACTGGAVHIVNDSINEIFNEKYGITNTEVLTVEEGFNGDVLIGTDGDGIFVVGAEGTEHYDTSSGLSSGVVMRIKKDPAKEVFWIVTSNSLAFADKRRTIQTIKDFPYSNNFDVYVNSRDEVWVLSSNGIYVASGREMLKNRKFSAIYYSRMDGLPCVPTANSYSDFTDDGNLYIAGSTGVAKINIETNFVNSKAPKAAVSFIEAEGKMYYPEKDGSFRIPASVKKITVYCHIFNYSLVNPIVSYRLKGIEKEFKTMMRSELVPIDYTNLRGGTYTFEMHMADMFGETESDMSVKIIKLKAFYEQFWFQALATIVIIGLISWIVYLYVSTKIRKYVERERQQEIFIDEMIEAFAKTIDMKDRYTNGHSFRVADYTKMLAKELGYKDEDIIKYHRIALLHDIGKIGVPAAVLNKQGKLTDEEFAIIKSHSGLGNRVLKDISIMPELAIGAYAHHERPDGKGYPRGLKGDEIPRVAQIIAVADTFDAMYSDRPYRKRMNFEKAVSIIKEGAGTQLAPDVVDAFLRLVDRGEFRAPDDVGGGTTEDINNIHKKQDKAQQTAEEKKAEAEEKSEKPGEAAEADKNAADEEKKGEAAAPEAAKDEASAKPAVETAVDTPKPDKPEEA